MPGQVTISLTDDAFQKTMTDYLLATSKDLAFGMNRTMNNMAIFGHQETKLAQKGEIERVQTLDWWPKYVASVMVRRKARSLAVRMEKASRKGKTISAKTYKRLEMLHYSREEARKISASMIRKRSVSIGFVRFFFVSLSRGMRQHAQGAKSLASKTFRGFETTIRPATENDLSVKAEVRYTYRRRGEQAVKKAEAMLQDIVDRARPRLIEDMRAYIASKARTTAARFSA